MIEKKKALILLISVFIVLMIGMGVTEYERNRTTRELKQLEFDHQFLREQYDQRLKDIQNLEQEKQKLQEQVKDLTVNASTKNRGIIVSRGGSYFGLNKKDLNLLARLITAEAKNQPELGKLAVGNVVLNRMKINNLSMRDIIYSTNQFQPVANGSINNEPTQEAIEAAARVLLGERVLPDDVYYFYNPKIVSRGSWIRSRKTYKTIGDHVFCYK